MRCLMPLPVKDDIILTTPLDIGLNNESNKMMFLNIIFIILILLPKYD
jgi:hypothetical protein